MFEPLPPDLARALQAAGLDGLQLLPDTDSTNDIALALAAEGAPDGTAVLADSQRAGRGRRGQTWFSPPGAGLYLSVVARFAGAPEPLPLVTLAAGVAAAEAVTYVSGLPVELKWPNDLVVGRPWRKLGGLLCESAGLGSRIDAVIIGIGVNLLVAAYPPAIADRATSIEAELGRVIDRTPLVIECLRRLRDRLTQVRREDAAGICAAWRRLARGGLHGAPVRWQDRDGAHRGLARDIDEAGALLVDVDGRLERLVSGEVIWELTRV